MDGDECRWGLLGTNTCPRAAVYITVHRNCTGKLPIKTSRSQCKESTTETTLNDLAIATQLLYTLARVYRQ